MLNWNDCKAESLGFREEVCEAAGFFLGSGFEGDGFRVGEFGLDHGVKDAGEFVGGGGDAFGFAEPGFHFAAIVAELGFAMAEGLGAEAKDGGDFVDDAACGGAKDFAAADAVVGAESEPGAEALGRGKGLEDLRSGAEFAHEGGNGGDRNAIDGGEVDLVKAQGFLENEVAVAGFVAGGGFGGFEVGGGGLAFGGDGLEGFLDFEVEVGDLLEEALVGLMGLAQDEEVFAFVVALEGLDDFFPGCAAAGMAAGMAEGGELGGVALAFEDGFDDGGAAEAVEVAEHMVEVEVHLGEGFLHELDLARGVGDEVGAVAQQGAQGEDVVGGAEAFAKQSGGVELLEPLGVEDIGFFAGDAFDMAGVDEENFDAGGFEDAVAGNPETTGAFHGDSGDVICQKPVAQLVEAFGEGGETADGFARALGRDGGNDLACGDVQTGGMGVEVALEHGGFAGAAFGGFEFGFFHRGCSFRFVDLVETGAAVAKRMEQSPNPSFASHRQNPVEIADFRHSDQRNPLENNAGIFLERFVVPNLFDFY